MAYSNNFKFFEEKLESILDINNYLTFSLEYLMLRKEAKYDNSNSNFCINLKPDNNSNVDDNEVNKNVKIDNYLQK